MSDHIIPIYKIRKKEATVQERGTYMIGISFNKRDFEYDAYTLVKAFYPQEEVENFYTEEGQEDKAWDLLVRITYGEEETHLSLERDGEIIFGEAARFEKGQDRKERKNILKQILYRGLVQETGITLPGAT